eukprot:6178222-Pleurochrysis_carterae.AAC.3
MDLASHWRRKRIRRQRCQLLCSAQGDVNVGFARYCRAVALPSMEKSGHSASAQTILLSGRSVGRADSEAADSAPSSCCDTRQGRAQGP